jgi:hypothetical protein
MESRAIGLESPFQAAELPHVSRAFSVASRHSRRSQFGPTAVSQLIDMLAHERPFALTGVGSTRPTAPRVGRRRCSRVAR